MNLHEYIRNTVKEYLNENKYKISKDEYGNYVVYNQNDYKILVNDKKSPTYITLWYFQNNKWEKVGALNVNISEVRFKNDNDFKKYYKVSEIEINPKHRGLGFGKMMYDILIDMRGDDIKGLYSYLPNRINKKEIPKIYRKYKSFIENDYEIIKFE
jgi:ribosomal protein S18 acetylase RimI-like enzyme